MTFPFRKQHGSCGKTWKCDKICEMFLNKLNFPFYKQRAYGFRSNKFLAVKL